jgi:hypothetical protein
MVWKAWKAPKVKLFSWLSIRNKIWMVDHLDRIGWDNCGLCPLCKKTQETTAHLFSHFHYSKRLWENGQELACPNPRMDTGPLHQSLVDYDAFQSKAKPQCVASLMMLVSWKIWKECSARVFNMKAMPTMVLLKIIKS